MVKFNIGQQGRFRRIPWYYLWTSFPANGEPTYQILRFAIESHRQFLEKIFIFQLPCDKVVRAMFGFPVVVSLINANAANIFRAARRQEFDIAKSLEPGTR